MAALTKLTSVKRAVLGEVKMQLKILGVGNSPLLSVKVKTLDDAGLLNISALARALGVHRSTFLSRVATHGLEAAILYYATQQKLKDVAKAGWETIRFFYVRTSKKLHSSQNCSCTRTIYQYLPSEWGHSINRKAYDLITSVRN
jgi:hypothetical protein